MLILTLLQACAAHARERSDASPDARIRYYRARLGGASTYPIYARLGIAYADRARARGSVADDLDAARYLRRSLAFQRNYEALLALSGVSLALHRFREALAYAREAAAAMPGDPAAQGALFDALLGSGDCVGAEGVLGSFPTKDGFAYRVRRGALLEYRGASREALDEVETACGGAETAAASPSTRAWCEVRRGAFQLALCRPDRARAAYDRALAILPGYFLAREHLAELDAAEGRTERAVAFYERRLALAPDPRDRLALATLYDTLQRRRRAAEQRRRARAELLERAAHDVRDAWHELALLAAADRATAADAVRWAEKDWRNRKDVHAADALAWARSQSGDAVGAETALGEALAPGGAPALVLLHAATIRWRARRADDARGLLERALVCPVAFTPAERRLRGLVERELAGVGREGAGSRRQPRVGRPATSRGACRHIGFSSSCGPTGFTSGSGRSQEVTHARREALARPAPASAFVR